MGLHEVLTRVVDTIHVIGATIHSTYFDVRFHTMPSSQPQVSNVANA